LKKEGCITFRQLRKGPKVEEKWKRTGALKALEEGREKRRKRKKRGVVSKTKGVTEERKTLGSNTHILSAQRRTPPKPFSN